MKKFLKYQKLRQQNKTLRVFTIYNQISFIFAVIIWLMLFTLFLFFSTTSNIDSIEIDTKVLIGQDSVNFKYNLL